MLMSAADYRESLRSYHPTVYVEGKRVESVADEPLLAPGINGIGVTYDFALQESSEVLMRTTAPRKLTSSIVPASLFRLLSPFCNETASGRRATERMSPALASPRPRAIVTSWPSMEIRPLAASITLPRNMLSVPTKEATKRVRGKL